MKDVAAPFVVSARSGTFILQRRDPFRAGRRDVRPGWNVVVPRPEEVAWNQEVRCGLADRYEYRWQKANLLSITGQ